MVAVAKAEAIHGLGVNTGLLHAGSGCRVAGLVDSGLKLLKEAVNVLKVTLGASIRKRERVAMLGHRAVNIGSTTRTATSATDVVATVGECINEASRVEATVRVGVGLVVVASVVAVSGSNGERQRVALKPLADIVVGAGVDSATLDVTEEVVQSLDGATAGVHALDVLYVVVGVRDGAVASVLCTVGLVVSRAVGTAHLRLVVGVGVHLIVRAAIVGTRCEPRNQVSLRVRGRVRRILTLPVLCTETTIATVGARCCARLRGVHQDTVVSVSLHMLLQILRAFEGLAAEVALVRLQGHMDADVRGDVITLDGGGAASTPLTGEVEVVGALATDMALADVVLRIVSREDVDKEAFATE